MENKENWTEKQIHELMDENEDLIKKIIMIKSHQKEMERNIKKLSTSFLQLLELVEVYRHNLEYDQKQTEEMKYEFLEKSGIL